MNDATIIVGKLDDEELRDSIKSLVKHVDKQTKAMVTSFNTAVGDINATLKKIGSGVDINLGSAASTAKRVADLKKEKQQVQDVAMSYDQMQSSLQKIITANSMKKVFGTEELQQYKELLRQLQAEYVRVNTQQGGGLKTDQIKNEISTLEGIINKYETILKNIEYVKSRQGTIDVRKWVQDLGAVDERYKTLVRWYTVLEKEDQRSIARAEKAYQKRLAELEKEQSARQKMAENARKAEEKYQDAVLKKTWRDTKSTQVTNADQAIAKIERLKALMNTLHPIGIISKTDVDNANALIAKLEQQYNIQKKIRETTVSPANATTAKDSMYNFLDLYTQKAAALRQELKNMPTTTWQNATEAFKRWQPEIDATKQKIQELKERLQNIVNPNAQKGVSNLLIEQQEKLRSLYQQQAQDVNNTIRATQAEAAAKKRAYEETQQQITQLVGKQGEFSAAVKKSTKDVEQQTTIVQKYTSEQINAYESIRESIRKTAREARESFARNNTYLFSTSSTLTGKAYTAEIFHENDVRAKGLSVEQQILQVKKQIRDDDMAHKQGLDAQLATEKAITAEVEKRQKINKYVTPDINEGGLRRLVSKAIKGDLADVDYSIKNTSKYLKQLQEAYNKLSSLERDTPFGKQLRQQIQDVSRAVQKLRSEMSRPVSLAMVKELPTKTIDDIIYKIQQLNNYKRGLNLFDEKQKGEIRQVDNEINKLQRDLQKYTQTTKQASDMNNALARSWNYMKNRLAFYFTVGASTSFVKNLIEIRSQYEMNERALGILIDSAERGTQIFNELSQMALVSPYTLIELSAAAKQLTAYDIAARDVVDTTRRLADMAAAVGIPIERLTYALGQVKAYGYLNARDARMFSNAGIPLVKELSQYYTDLEGRMISVADVYDKIKKKAIDYNTVMSVITKMTDEGGKFFNFQAKMADTLKVRLANLTLAWNNMLNDIGKESQGLLTFTIDGLKKLFLHWKELDKLIKEAAYGYGIAVALMLWNTAITRVYGSSGKLLKMFTMNAVLGTRLANVIRSIGASMKTLFTTPMTWFMVAALWVFELGNAIANANEATKEFNKNLRDSAKNTYEELSNFLNEDSNLNLRAELNKGDINPAEATKAWENMREQIELSSRNSEEFVQRLMAIENTSERLRQGFNILEEISAVNAAFKEMDDTTIKITQDWSAWWNAWQAPDGLIGNLKDYTESLNEYNERNKKAVNDAKQESLWKEQQEDLERLKKDVAEFTDSIDRLINSKEWGGDIEKINETYSKAVGYVIEKYQLNPENAFQLQLIVEEARSKAAKQALEMRIEDEKAALKIAADDNARTEHQITLDKYNAQLAEFDKANGRGKVLWSQYTKWLKEQHISEVREMFRGMTADEIAKIDFSEKKWADFANTTANKFAKEHNLATNDVFTLLHDWVKNANQWSIFIPLIISSEGDKSLFDTLKELDSQIDTADNTIKRLKTRIEELQKIPLITRTREQIDELARAEKELADAEYAKQRAEEQGGHGKQEGRDEKAAAKAEAKRRRDEERERRRREREAAKQRREEESELQRALKNELSLIDKVRNVYKDLTKEGMTHANAIQVATHGYDNTVKDINSVLSKWGIKAFDLTKYAGIGDPNTLVMMLEAQLKKLKESGRAKPAEIKDFEVKIKDLRVDAEKYNLSMVTKGLNNELDRLKDEYELAVELDANPELSDAFQNIFGIDSSDFPHSIDAYVQKAQAHFEMLRYLMHYGIGLDIVKASEKDWNDWGKAVGIAEDKLKDIKSTFGAVAETTKKWVRDVVQQTKDLQYKLSDTNGKIIIEEEKKAQLVRQFMVETNLMQKQLLALQIADQEKVIEKLKESLFELLPTYQAVFGGVAEHSAALTRKLAKQLKTMLETATQNPDGSYTVTDPKTGEKATLSREAMGRNINKVNKELLKTSSVFNKLKEAFTKGEDGEIDYVKGIELIGDELKKLGDLVSTIGDISAALGLDEKSAENVSDIAKTLEGLGQAAEGYAQMKSGDIIGGATNIVKGLWTSISTWFDNTNNEITREFEKSEMAVKQLQLAYKDLEDAVEDAYGVAIIGAKQAAAANKKLELAELNRQLRLEKSRDSKNRDKNKIIELQGAIKDLEREIKKASEEIVNDLLGISSVGDAAQSFMDAYIEALRSGEDAMSGFNESVNEMIANLIKKIFVTRVIGPQLEKIIDEWQRKLEARSGKEAELYANAQKQVSYYDSKTDQELADELTKQKYGEAWILFAGDEARKYYLSLLSGGIAALRKAAEEDLEKAGKDLNAATQPSKNDVGTLVEQLRSISPILADQTEEIVSWLREFGLMKSDTKDKTLSALQQGIQGITEDTAGALEAYMNSVSQQVYLQTDLLTQIRDAVVMLNTDVQVATIGQILLQLQASYQVQMSINNTLNSWANPSGQAVRVEMI